MRNHSSLHIKTTTMLAWNLEFLMKLIVVLKEYNNIVQCRCEQKFMTKPGEKWYRPDNSAAICLCFEICDQQQTPYIGEIFSGEHVAIGVLSAV